MLLVDDDPEFLSMARRVIARERVLVDVRFVNEGAEALRLLGIASGSRGFAENVVAMFVDLHMPGMDGWEILRRVRSHVVTRQIPVIIVSSSSDEDDVRSSYERGANSYMVKHQHPEEPGHDLIRAIRYWSELNRAPWAPGAVA